MSRTHAVSLGVALLLLGDAALLAQAPTPAAPAYGARSAGAARLLPMTSSSAPARAHAALGQRALDTGHPVDAAEHFRLAVAADSAFAFAHFGLANSSNSVGDFTAHLRDASRLASRASRPEQLMIAIAEKGLDADQQGALALARELVRAAPDNPRPHLILANTLTALGREAEARQSMQRAIAVAPDFAPAYIQLGYSYLLTAPRAPAKAEAVIRKAVALEPREALPYIALGSWGRATNKLEQARLAYTNASRLEPTNALPVQQRAHVEAFLGDYDAARADYDAAIRLGRANEPATYAIFRALVPTYAGNPGESVAEYDRLIAAIDTMAIPDRDGARVFALTQQALIATHSGAFDDARRALDRLTPLLRKQATQVGTPDFARTQEANIAVQEGLLAARPGDFAAATAKAKQAISEVADVHSSTKDQGAYGLLGIVALDQKRYAEALAHFDKASPNDVYIKYHRALALEGAGRLAEAKRLFREVADFNFSSANEALGRADARKRAG
jgi:tetratricopeptide (TPR) repeat protein